MLAPMQITLDCRAIMFHHQWFRMRSCEPKIGNGAAGLFIISILMIPCLKPLP